jgi:hypothetical protein
MRFVRPIATVISQAGFEVPEYTLNLEKVTKFVQAITAFKNGLFSGNRRSGYLSMRQSDAMSAQLDVGIESKSQL